MPRITKKQLVEDVEFLHEYARQAAGHLSGAPMDDSDDAEDAGDYHIRVCEEARERLLRAIGACKVADVNARKAR